MTNAEEKLIARWSASRYFVAGLVIAAAGYLPLQLYIVFGPRDGNPIGLGLLAVIAIPLGLAVCAVGLIKLVVGHFVGRKR